MQQGMAQVQLLPAHVRLCYCLRITYVAASSALLPQSDLPEG